MKKLLKYLLALFIAFCIFMIATISYFTYKVSKDYEGVIDNYEPFTPSIIYDINGKQIDVISVENRDPISINEIPSYVQNAFIAVEDKRFRNHHGIDYIRLTKAIFKNITRTGTEGGSTITQQLIKTLFLTSERSIIKRKIPEAILAIQMERKYTKDEILELYLNTINFGRRAYGIKNAAATYFNKKVDELTIAEAAVLASIPKSPTKYSKLENVIPRHNIVLNAMYKNSYITKEEYENAKNEEIVFFDKNNTSNTTESISSTNTAPEFTTEVIKEMMEILNISEDEPELLFNGYKVYSTMDISMQKAAYKAFSNSNILKNDKELEGALISIDPSNGFVKAMVGGKDYIKGYFNRATQATRQPGSSFKPFVYLEAIKKNYPASLSVEDSKITIGNWSPKNYSGKYLGALTMIRGLELSTNIVAVKILDLLNVNDVIENFVLATDTNPNNLPKDLTLALGSATITPLELATGYASFANGGYKVKPEFIYKIEDKFGNIIYEAKPIKEEIFEKEDVAILTKMLMSVINYGIAISSKVYKDGNLIPMAGKTGTTNKNISVWFAGYTPTLSTVVYVGNDNNKPISSKATGGSTAMPIWRDYMQNVVNIRDYEVGTFEYIENLEKEGKIIKRNIDIFSGLLDTDGINQREVYFKLGTEPVEYENNILNEFTY